MLGTPFTVIFTRAVHELVHNKGCGPLPPKNADPWTNMHENWSFLGDEDPYYGLFELWDHVVWLFITNISEKHTAFIFYPKNGSSMFLEALIPAYQNIWFYNLKDELINLLTNWSAS